MLVMVSAICFILFVVFNYVLYNPDSGVDTILDEKANDMFNPNNLGKWSNTRGHIATGFGMAGVVTLFAAILSFVLMSIKTMRVKV